MNTLILAAAVVIGLSTLPAQASSEKFGPDNPFFAPSSLPFQAPPFDKIGDTDYQPAIDAGMAEHWREARVIADNPAPPTFENTFVAMEKSGRLLDRVMSVFDDQRQHQSRPGKSASRPKPPNLPPTTTRFSWIAGFFSA